MLWIDVNPIGLRCWGLIKTQPGFRIVKINFWKEFDMFKTPEHDLKVPCGTPKSSKSILVLKHHETTMVLGIPQFNHE